MDINEDILENNVKIQKIDTQRLIKAIRDKKLYASSLLKTRDRASLWHEVATELNSSVEDIKTKWHTLRSNYMRERKKKKYNPEFQGPLNRSWPYFDSLKFLDPTRRSKRKENVTVIVTGPSKEEIVEEFDTEDVGAVETVFVDPDTANYENDADAPTKSVTDQVNSIEPAERIDYFKKRKRSADCERDPDAMFFESLIPFVKKLGPLENLELKGEIIAALKRKLEDNRPIELEHVQFYSTVGSSVLASSTGASTITDKN